MSYNLEGQLLEVCNCDVLCPCWIGEDPDYKTCEASLAYRFQRGEIDGIDVSGLTLALAAHIPGNVLQGNWKVTLFLDQRATKEQEEALLSVFSGKQGGPVADVAGLIGEVTGVERVPITFNVERGKGTLKLGDVVYAELEPYLGANDQPTTLVDTIFTTIPGAPAYVSKAPRFRLKSKPLGIDLDLQNHNAVQGTFAFHH